jgi:hypothetical protein
MTDSNAKHFELKETKLNHDLEHGQQVDTSMLLLAEVHKNPEEFRALVKRSMDMPESQKASAKFHLNVDKNGDVFVWDPTEHNGMYCGHDDSFKAPADVPPAPAAAPAPIADAAPIPLAAPSDAPAPAQAQIEAPPAPASPHAMYSPRVDSPYRPAPAVCHAPREFQGLNLGLIKIGVYDHKSFGVGVNAFGLAGADGMIGGHTGVDARAGFSKLGACGSAGLDIDQNGLQPRVSGHANVVDLVGGGGDVGAVLGPNSGVYGNASAEVLGAHGGVSEVVTGDDRGLAVTHYADAGFLNAIDVNHKAHAEISEDSKVSSSAGVRIGPAGIEAGAGVQTEGDTRIAPRGYVDFASGPDHGTLHADGQIGPTVDARAGVGVTSSSEANPGQFQNNELQAGVGQSGVGIKGVESTPRYVQQAGAGVGDDYPFIPEQPAQPAQPAALAAPAVIEVTPLPPIQAAPANP